MLHDGSLQTGDSDCTFKRGFELSLGLTGRSLLSQEEGCFRRLTGSDAREGIPLVREFARRRIGTHVGEDSAVNDLLIAELKRIKQISN
jgi:hypothetical protein